MYKRGAARRTEIVSSRAKATVVHDGQSSTLSPTYETTIIGVDIAGFFEVSIE